MVNYNYYSDFVKSVVNSKDLSCFKSHPAYVDMLDHVSQSQGYEYLNYIKNLSSISIEEIINFCELNDKLGSPNKSDFGFMIASPTSLRYIWHAHIILSYFKSFNKDTYDIIEVGGGYGGLCFAIHYFSKKYDVSISSYTIVDLKPPSELQKIYLDTLNLGTNIYFVDAEMYGSEIDKKNNFLISNYCFSEIDESHQKKYIEILFPKISHGFMAWNNIPVYDFGYFLKIDEEVPKTGGMNKFIYF
jgi:hypothetical protein